MKPTGTAKMRLGARLSSMVSSETPIRDLASNFSKMARTAINEATTLEVEKVGIIVPRLPRKLDGFRIVHLSDFHHSRFTDLEHIENAVTAANEMCPDIVLLTGDYVSHDSAYVVPVAETLGRLRSVHGTYACLGNHDHWTDPRLVESELGMNGIRVLVNEGFRFTSSGVSFWLCGVDDHMVKRTDLKAALMGSFPDEMKMLLAHNPVIIRQAARRGVDLVFSGHTHGGQVKIREKEKKILPHRRLSSGLHRRKDTQVYITRGIGTVVLPVRYQCPPEISLVELNTS